MKMDWVIIYMLVLFSVNLGASIEAHGKPKKGKNNAWITIIGILLMTPIIGRVFGWW